VQIIIDPSGVIRTIHKDALAGLYAEGKATIRRASHVEPNDDGQWVVDLSPVGGPQMGPFALRADALAAEVEWLESHGTPVPE